ncbi:MAG: hypothetical protein PHE89_06100 [Alphaproteobacteria bacterium]|nr:hypothetical protein [Alphaproteobacteria bacterium]
MKSFFIVFCAVVTFQVSAQNVKDLSVSKAVLAVQKDVLNQLDTVVQARGFNSISADGKFSSSDLITCDWKKGEKELDLFDGSYSVLVYEQESNKSVIKSVVIYYEKEGEDKLQKITIDKVGDKEISNLIGDYEIIVSKWIVEIVHVYSQNFVSFYFTYKDDNPLYY